MLLRVREGPSGMGHEHSCGAVFFLVSGEAIQGSLGILVAVYIWCPIWDHKLLKHGLYEQAKVAGRSHAPPET